MKNFEEKAIPLIVRPQGKKYQVNPEAIKFFASIQGKIAIISVAGVYRTGKSYLLNTIMLKQKAGFAVGPTTNPKTKGIWVWGKPLILKNQKDQIINVCVLDSQGLGSIEEDINHDLRLFSITLLLSSMFIYNTLGAIDQNAIDSLGLVLKLCEHLKAQNYNDFPDFYWVLRDFSLALVGKDNKPLTPNKYLDNALSSQPGDSQVRNKIRSSIRSSFTNRNCFTFVRPLTDQSCLQNLQKMQIDQLRPEFMEQVIDFRKLINSNIKTKKIKGKEINSQLLIQLINIYVGQINGKEMPQIETGWKYVCAKECQNVMNLLEKETDDITNKMLDNLPNTKKQLLDKKENIYDNLKKIFQSRTLNNDQATNYLPEISKMLEKKMQKIEEQMKLKNSQQTKNFIKKQFQNIERRLKQNEFKSMGEVVKQFQLFYEYYRKKCPFKDEIQTGLEFLIKKFSDCSLIMFKSMKGKKDQQVMKLKQDLQKLSGDMVVKQEKYKHQKTTYGDRNAILQSKIDELMKQNKELSHQLMKIEQDHQKLKEEYEQSKSKASQEIQYELIMMRKKLMESQDVVKEMECKKMLEINNFKNVIMLKENQVAHLIEEKTTITSKLASLSQELALEKDQKHKKLQQLQTGAEVLKIQNQTLKKKTEEKIIAKDLQIAKLQSCIQGKSSQIAKLIQDQERALKTTQQGFEVQKSQLMQTNKQQIKNLKQIIQAHEDGLTIKIKRAEAEYTQKQMDLRMHRLQVDRQMALLNQKIQFLRRQCEQKQERIGKLLQENSNYMNMFEEKDNQLSNISNILDQLRNNHQSSSTDMSTRAEEMAHQLQERTKEINQLEELNQRIQAQLREKNQQIKTANQKIKNNIKTYQEKIKDLNQKLTYQIQCADKTKVSFEVQIQTLKNDNSKNIEEQKRNAELSLVQLKNYYEMERERLEKKNLQDRKKHQYTETNVTSELENKHRKIIRGLQEEIQQLRMAKQHLEQQLSRVENDCQLKISNIEEEREIQKKQAVSKYQALERRHEQLQNDFDQFQKNYEEQRITFVKKIETLNFQLSRKEKQLMQGTSKKESLENSLAKKDTQLDNMKKLMNQQIESSLKKVSDIQVKYQKLNQEYMQMKIQSEKEIALSKQRNQFLNAKLSELTKEKEVNSSKNLQKIDKAKITQLKEQVDKSKAEIMSLQGKLQNYRKVNKQQESSAKKIISSLQKDNELLKQKESINQSKISDLQAKVQQKTDNFLKELEQARNKYTVQRQLLQKQCDQLRQKITSIEDQTNSASWSLQKDIALLNQRIKYAEYQRDQTKKELEESEKRYQQTFSQLKKATEKANEDSEVKKNYSDKKYSSQIDILKEALRNKGEEYEETIKKQKDQIRQLKDKNNQISDRLQNVEKMRNNEKSLQQQNQNLKKQKQNLMSNYRSERTKENEEWKRKMNQLDKKSKEFERKNMEYVFVIEKQNSKWLMQKQNLYDKIKSLEDAIDWERSKSQLNKSKHQLKKSDSGNPYQSDYGKYGNWKS